MTHETRPHLTDERTLIGTLTRLGDTSDEIAARLKSEGVLGHRASSTSCPVARYLVRTFGGKTVSGLGASVSTERVGMLLDYEDPVGDLCIAEVWADTPDVVSDFVTDFDDGAYPDLIDTESSS